jgi:hypothetical protein
MVGSEVASRLRGMPRPPKLLCGLLEDRTWAMMPQRGGRSPTAEGVPGDAGWSGWGVDRGAGVECGWGWRFGAGRAQADENETEGGNIAGFVVDDEVEAVGEEGVCIMRRIWSMVELSGARASMLNRSAETSKPPVTQPGALDSQGCRGI